MELFKGQIKDFNITQISSNDGKNFPTLHKVIHRKNTLSTKDFRMNLNYKYKKYFFHKLI